MAKISNARISALKGKFETGDKPPGADYADLIDALQEAAQEHDHLSTGGPGTANGDAGLIRFLSGGADVSKDASPAVLQVYLATDTTKVYVCFSVGVWTCIYEPA